MAEVTLEFIGKQLERMLAEQGAQRDEMVVLTARMSYVDQSMERLEAHLVVLTTEVRALRREIGRMNDRIIKLEEPAA